VRPFAVAADPNRGIRRRQLSGEERDLGVELGPELVVELMTSPRGAE
jgi:hypothetical protein